MENNGKSGKKAKVCYDDSYYFDVDRVDVECDDVNLGVNISAVMMISGEGRNNDVIEVGSDVSEIIVYGDVDKLYCGRAVIEGTVGCVYNCYELRVEGKIGNSEENGNYEYQSDLMVVSGKDYDYMTAYTARCKGQPYYVEDLSKPYKAIKIEGDINTLTFTGAAGLLRVVVKGSVNFVSGLRVDIKDDVDFVQQVEKVICSEGKSVLSNFEVTYEDLYNVQFGRLVSVKDLANRR